jgi:hypothetical protein
MSVQRLRRFAAKRTLRAGPWPFGGRRYGRGACARRWDSVGVVCPGQAPVVRLPREGGGSLEGGLVMDGAGGVAWIAWPSSPTASTSWTPLLGSRLASRRFRTSPASRRRSWRGHGCAKHQRAHRRGGHEVSCAWVFIVRSLRLHPSAWAVGVGRAHRDKPVRPRSFVRERYVEQSCSPFPHPLCSFKRDPGERRGLAGP